MPTASRIPKRSPIQILLLRGRRERSPHYQKLYSRVNHIWINRKGQPILSAMERPHPGGTTLVIMVASEPELNKELSHMELRIKLKDGIEHS
ncbi:hypothetical protein OUZ56_012257 [Daphnia magna]|uniref:Uncharacterized protein n=1 Tax=Daphnia magna TaxID=35525 RepID=A0ABQ9Z2H2_9CRUS|nr:hypothetical protein OUZ56_012257 [Daphnia magna]